MKITNERIDSETKFHKGVTYKGKNAVTVPYTWLYKQGSGAAFINGFSCAIFGAWSKKGTVCSPISPILESPPSK